MAFFRSKRFKNKVREAMDMKVWHCTKNVLGDYIMKLYVYLRLKKRTLFDGIVTENKDSGNWMSAFEFKYKLFIGLSPF